jgi:hypothetical protein
MNADPVATTDLLLVRTGDYFSGYYPPVDEFTTLTLHTDQRAPSAQFRLTLYAARGI